MIRVSIENAHQTQDMSWWPKSSIWKGSGLDVGHWTIDCETWYIVRRTAILNNDATVGKLRNATQWRNSLKFTRKRSQDVQKANADFSRQILEQL